MRYLLKRLVATVNRNELRGWKNVFAFTFIQSYKSKATIIGLAVMCIIIMLAGPVMTLTAGSQLAGKFSDLTDCKIEKMYLINETDTEFDTEGFKENYPQYSKINFILTDESSEEVQTKLDENALKDILLCLHKENNGYFFSYYKSKDSEISSMTVSEFSDCAEDYYLGLRMKSAGVSDETMARINADRSVDVVDFSEISQEDSDHTSEFVMFAVIMYAMVIMMAVLISSQQISVSIVTEKSSKVIETLLLSVRPLAVIVGKITGTMAVLVCNAVLFIISGTISGAVTSVIAAKKFSEVMIEGLAKMSAGDLSAEVDMSAVASMNITPFRIIFGIAAIVITTVLAYVFYAVISGINGASCSSMDDLQSASAFISLSTVIGVYLVIGAEMADKPALTQFAYLFPFSGIYMVPVEYLFGRASLSDVMILWAELIILTALLFRFAAKIYHVLIYHRGERLKLKNLIEISKSQKGGV